MLPNLMTGLRVDCRYAAAPRRAGILNADKDEVQIGRIRRRRADPVGFDVSPDFTSALGTERIEIAVVAAEENAFRRDVRGRPNSFRSSRRDFEAPARLAARAIDAAQFAGIRTEINQTVLYAWCGLGYDIVVIRGCGFIDPAYDERKLCWMVFSCR